MSKWFILFAGAFVGFTAAFYTFAFVTTVPSRPDLGTSLSFQCGQIAGRQVLIVRGIETGGQRLRFGALAASADGERTVTLTALSGSNGKTARQLYGRELVVDVEDHAPAERGPVRRVEVLDARGRRSYPVARL